MLPTALLSDADRNATLWIRGSAGQHRLGEQLHRAPGAPSSTGGESELVASLERSTPASRAGALLVARAHETMDKVCLMQLEPHPSAVRGHGGIALAADTWGDPAGLPVVLLHGGGQTRHSWAATARRLAARGYHVVTLDLRGHGDSDWAPDADYSLESFALDVVAVAAACRTRPALVGASLGGLSALLAEGELAPDTASAVVLVDVAPRLEPEGVARILAFMSARPEGFVDLDDAADAIAAYLPHRPRPTDLTGLAKNLRIHPDGRYRWHWDPAFLDGPRRPSGAAQADRLFAAARRIDAPVLVVRGRESDMVSAEGAEELVAATRRGLLVDVEGARHMVAGDRNDVFADAVVAFLDREIGGTAPLTIRKEATS
jgi:pimeloyl-ACP methyl ester carboxylesterase